MTNPATTSANATSAADRLAEEVAALRVPPPEGDNEHLLLKVGVTLPLIGLVLLAITWFQASGTAYVADQIPMLVSGGLVALLITMVGIGIVLRYSVARTMRFWAARNVVEQKAQTDRLIEAVERLEVAVRAATTDAPVVVEVPKDR